MRKMGDPGTHFALSIIGGVMVGCLYYLYFIHQKLSELVEILKPEEEVDEDD